MKTRIYFDHNATTPPSSEVRAGVLEWLEAWGNPSSVHQSGRTPKALMRWARNEVANMIGADPLEVIFTSGGSESNNLALKGVFFKSKEQGKKHILLSRIEHPSLMKTAAWLASQGAEVEFIEVNRKGEIDLEKYQQQVRTDTAVVSVMLANNETGNIFPIKKMTKIAHEKGALFHTDAVQALGKMRFGVKDLDVDLASFSGHKFYALKGVGVLYSKRGTQIEPLIHGGGQERSRRAGTENLLAISSLAAMGVKLKELESKLTQLQTLRDQMETLIEQKVLNIKFTGRESKRVVNTSSFIVEGVDGETLLMNLDMEGISVSTGAACSSGAQEPSPVLRAMGLSREEAQSSLRVSLGWDSTFAEVERFCETLQSVVSRIRSFGPEIRL